jgi:hypothetical protein
MSRRTFVIAIAALAGAWACTVAGASAKAGPAPGTMQGGAGVLSRDGAVRYVALSNGASTSVQRIATNGGRVLRFGWISGDWGVPLVTFNGQAEGLSRDGGTLLLGPATYVAPGAAVTRFALVDARKLKLRGTIALKGAFSYDAMSPDLRTLYLIHYLSADSANYEVRAFDLASRKLVPGAIVDKREAEEEMNGSPVARTLSRNGAWAFTLYARASEPFVHALDTVNRRAVCVDLPWAGADALWKVRLRMGAGGQVVLEQPSVGKLAVIDTKTWKVTTYRQPVKR